MLDALGNRSQSPSLGLKSSTCPQTPRHPLESLPEAPSEEEEP